MWWMKLWHLLAVDYYCSSFYSWNYRERAVKTANELETSLFLLRSWSYTVTDLHTCSYLLISIFTQEADVAIDAVIARTALNRPKRTNKTIQVSLSVSLLDIHPFSLSFGEIFGHSVPTAALQDMQIFRLWKNEMEILWWWTLIGLDASSFSYLY